MGTRAIGVAAVVTLLATAGLAAAQQPSFTVTVEPQGEAGSISTGESADVNVLVRLEGDNFSCAEDEDLPVQMSVDPAGGVSGTADPAELVFSGTMGVWSSDSPAGHYNESQETTVTVEASNSASPGSHDVTVNGVFPGGDYGPPDGTCGGSFPSAEDSADIPVTVESQQTDDGTDTGTDGTDGDDDDSPATGNGTDTEDGDDGNGIPLGPWLAPLAFVGAALALRRR